jgi:hypothetical protein
MPMEYPNKSKSMITNGQNRIPSLPERSPTDHLWGVSNRSLEPTDLPTPDTQFVYCFYHYNEALHPAICPWSTRISLNQWLPMAKIVYRPYHREALHTISGGFRTVHSVLLTFRYLVLFLLLFYSGWAPSVPFEYPNKSKSMITNGQNRIPSLP